MKPRQNNHNNHKLAVTLVEMMVTVGIISLVFAMLGVFLGSSSRLIIYSNQQLSVNNSLRLFTELILRSAGSSDYMFLYKDPSSPSSPSESWGVQPYYPNVKENGSMYEGSDGWGDLLVFIRLGPYDTGTSFSNPIDAGESLRPYQKLYCFSRTVKDAHTTQLWYYEIDVPASQGHAILTSLLPSSTVPSNALHIADCPPTGDNKRMAFLYSSIAALINLEFFLNFRNQVQSASLNMVAICPLSIGTDNIGMLATGSTGEPIQIE